MKKNYTLHKLLSLALMLSMVSLFTACGCGRSTVDENNNTTNTTTESGTNGNQNTHNNTTTESHMNGSSTNNGHTTALLLSSIIRACLIKSLGLEFFIILTKA